MGKEKTGYQVIIKNMGSSSSKHDLTPDGKNTPLKRTLSLSHMNLKLDGSTISKKSLTRGN